VTGSRQQRQACLDAQDRALEVGAQDAVDVILGHVGQARGGEDARVGAEHVDAAEPLRGLRGDLAQSALRVTSART